MSGNADYIFKLQFVSEHHSDKGQIIGLFLKYFFPGHHHEINVPWMEELKQ